MKNIPLAVQIWLVLASITLLILIGIMVFLPGALSGFVTQQVYTLLQDAQQAMLVMEGNGVIQFPIASYEGEATQPLPTGIGTDSFVTIDSITPMTIKVRNDQVEVGTPALHHLVLNSVSPFPLDAEGELVAQAVRGDAQLQTQPVQRYSREINDQTLLYVIRKEMIQGQPFSMVSYAWSNYRNQLVGELFLKLMWVFLSLVVLSWLPSLWLARYISRPLVQMEAHVARIGDRDWHEPLILPRRDEIGRLAQAFEQMRIRLQRLDQAQRSYLQMTSHELKTPVMVIQSYAQSILDGIYPKGDLASSVQIIASEAQRLENRVRDTLYLTKLDYLATRNSQPECFDLCELINASVERFAGRRTDLEWALAIHPALIEGDREQWSAVIDNLIDNQLRYARTQITIEDVSTEPGQTIIRIGNDGPQIEPSLLATLFQPYQAGKNGEFGLGLSIAKQVVERHLGTLRVANENGVAFYLTINSQTK